jgi:hypothetical protein
MSLALSASPSRAARPIKAQFRLATLYAVQVSVRTTVEHESPAGNFSWYMQIIDAECFPSIVSNMLALASCASYIHMANGISKYNTLLEIKYV